MDNAEKEVVSMLLESRSNGISFAKIMNEFPKCDRIKHAQNFIDSLKSTPHEPLHSASWQESYYGMVRVGITRRDFPQEIWSMEFEKAECLKKK